MKKKLVPSAYYMLLFCILWVSCEEVSEDTTPVFIPMTESIYASVQVIPEDLYEVYANGQGLLQSLYVEEGTLVKKGQKIALLQSERVDANLSNARLSLELAKANFEGNASAIEALTTELQAAEKQLSLDSTNYIRQKVLWERQIGSKVELDQKMLKFELSQKSVQGIKTKIQQSKRELKKAVQQSKNNLKTALAQQGDFIISSKINGQVYSVFKEEGELISAQQPIVSIGSESDFLIRMQIDEVDIVQVSKGMEVIITLDAYSDQTFTAKVSRILPSKDLKTQTFFVEGKFVTTPPQLYPGLAGEANIVTKKKDRILAIPPKYLYNTNKVLTKDGEVEIKVGSKNFNWIEVISGIDSSTTLILPEK